MSFPLLGIGYFIPVLTLKKAAAFFFKMEAQFRSLWRLLAHEIPQGSARSGRAMRPREPFDAVGHFGQGGLRRIRPGVRRPARCDRDGRDCRAEAAGRPTQPNASAAGGAEEPSATASNAVAGGSARPRLAGEGPSPPRPRREEGGGAPAPEVPRAREEVQRQQPHVGDGRGPTQGPDGMPWRAPRGGRLSKWAGRRPATWSPPAAAMKEGPSG